MREGTKKKRIEGLHNNSLYSGEDERNWAVSHGVCLHVRVCVRVCARLCLLVTLSFLLLLSSSRPQSVRHGRVILTWCKSPSRRLVSSLCVVQAEARCLYANSTHIQGSSVSQSQTCTIIETVLFQSTIKKQGEH